MKSGQTAFWRVRTWDDTNQAGAWSEIASWEVGLRDARDWRAKWITVGDVRPTSAIDLRYASYESTDRKTMKDVFLSLRARTQDGRLNFAVGNDALGGLPRRRRNCVGRSGWKSPSPRLASTPPPSGCTNCV